MRKIIIPFLGLFVLILLTPFILGKLANSNIDRKVDTYKNNGFVIKELNKTISYLTTNRKFEVILNKQTKNKNWKVLDRFIDRADFLVDLKFKNLPVTKADMKVLIKGIEVDNFNYLNGIKIHLISKNLKTFDYQVFSENKDIKIRKFFGEFDNQDKISTNNFNMASLNYKNNFIIYGVKGKIFTKNFVLGLIDSSINIKRLFYKMANLEIQFLNLDFNNSTTLSGKGIYHIKDNLSITKSKVKFGKIVVKFGNLDLKVETEKKANTLKNMKVKTIFKWDKTNYDNVLVDGAKIELNFKILNPKLDNVKDIVLKGNLELSKSLFNKLKTEFNPEIFDKYIKNYKMDIEIKNGEVIVNGNRI